MAGLKHGRRRKRGVPDGIVVRRKTALYRVGKTQQDVADEVRRRRGGRPVSRQAVASVANGHIRSRDIEEAYASLCEVAPERLGWPHAREDSERARAAAAKQSA